MHEPGFDQSIPCICCNKVVLIRSTDWTDQCVGICMTCYRSFSDASIRLTFFLRCQIAALSAQVAEAQATIDKMVGQFKQLEDELFEPA